MCPAASFIEGPPGQGPSALCGVIGRDREREGLPARPGQDGVRVASRSDPSTFHHFCTGNYMLCPVWRAERERLWAQGERVLSGVA
jgi:hypothetical protein